MSTPWYSGDTLTLYHGECLGVLRELPDRSVDAVVTDPPYGLSQLGPDLIVKALGAWLSGDREHVPDGRGFMGNRWDAFVPPPAAFDECMRVLKPGGHLLCFAGSRTVDLMAMSIRLAGFEIRDSIAWLYGSGFPKSLDVSKAIDKAAGAEREVVGQTTHPDGRPRALIHRDQGVHQGGQRLNGVGLDITAPATEAAQQLQGWGTALKPAFEPIVVGRKPLVGTVAANVLEHGTGALNIDACRVEGEPWKAHRATGLGSIKYFSEGDTPVIDKEPHAAGRWPTNVVLGESQAVELDGQTGFSRSPSGPVVGQRRRGGVMGAADGNHVSDSGHGDSGGASRFFPVFKYQAKAPARERPKVDGIAHPTVKPLDLMRWLVRLVTPPGGTVLDPFAGSGTTAEACVIEGFKCIAVEEKAEYLPLILHRMNRPSQSGLDFEWEDQRS